MLFNSFIFLFAFLPLVLAAFYASRAWVSARASIAVLLLASLVFYAYWNPEYLVLLLASITSQLPVWAAACGKRSVEAGLARLRYCWLRALR
jgi:alginate O-acetyltransferase complex protein AlgI